MPLAEIQSLLASRLGFDTSTVGPGVVASVVRRCAKEAGVPDLAAYARLLARSAAEWERLADQVLVPETWFFRDGAPFDLLARVASDYAGGTPPRTFRMLSAPCSTGEEPYSIAMRLFDEGLLPGMFIVDAFDLRRSALDAARAGLFRARTLRADRHGCRDRYFDHVGDQWRVRPSVKAAVRFDQGNLISPAFLAGEPKYDVIFCRNLLIYLHADARRAVFKNLLRLLADGGTLIVGHAESSVAREYGLRPSGPAKAFAFTAPGATPATHGHAHAAKAKPAAVARARPAHAVNLLAPKPRTTSVTATIEAAGPELPLLAQASRLADAGQLKAAESVCREFLRDSPDSADGHFLLGVLHEVAQDPDQAERCFRKALYLHPGHHSALLHLALNCERRGDRAGAALLRDRAKRAVPA